MVTVRRGAARGRGSLLMGHKLQIKPGQKALERARSVSKWGAGIQRDLLWLQRTNTEHPH